VVDVRFYNVPCATDRLRGLQGGGDLSRRCPYRCGAEDLIRRFRTECFQLDEPELHDADGRPLVGAGWDFPGCGARPFWPLHYCWHVRAELTALGQATFFRRGGAVARAWPNLCDDFPGEEPETLGWLGCCCWGGP